MKKHLLLLAIATILSVQIIAQNSEIWVKRFNGAANDYGYDKSNSITVDSQGNVYVTGSSVGASYNIDFVTIKYDANGNEIWRKTYAGAENKSDIGYDVAVDANGNVYVTGETVTTATLKDIITIKYNSAGTQQWAMIYNGVQNVEDKPCRIVLDDSANVYVGAYINDDYQHLVYCDWAVIKYSTDGVQKWIKTVNGNFNSQDKMNDLTIDSDANIYATGYTTNFGGSYTAEDYTTVKLDRNGNLQWSMNHTNTNTSGNYDQAWGIAVDNSGNVIVTGVSGRDNTGSVNDCGTVKYNSNGAEQWFVRYVGASSGEGMKVAVDEIGNSYVACMSLGSGEGITTIKYDASGNQIWTKSTLGIPTGIKVDTLNKAIYVIGTGGTYHVTKYDYDGNEIWQQKYDGSFTPSDLGLDESGNIIVTGNSVNTGSSSYNTDYLTIKYGPVLTAINSVESGNNSFEIYPNPAKDQITINFENNLISNNYSYKITNTLGQTIYSNSINKQSENIQLNSNLENGIYFIQIIDNLNNTIDVSKIIVRK